MPSYIVSWPTSTNSLYRTVGRRPILSAAARTWYALAAQELMVQRARAVLGPVEVTIELSPPHKRRYDLDNRAKAVLDLLVKNAIIEADDNSVVKRLTITEGEGFSGARITIEAVASCERMKHLLQPSSS